MTTTRKTATRAGRSAALLACGLLIAAAALYAGARWHESLDRLIGRDVAVATAQAEHGTQLWTCGMHPQVIQDHPGTCPICHMTLTPLKTDGATASANSPTHDSVGPGPPAYEATPAPRGDDSRHIKYWWDPMMNPPYVSDKPGKSPMGMDLVPVYEDESVAAPTTGTVVIDPSVVQNMGVRTALVSEGPLDRPVRLVGYLDEAQPRVHDINLRVSGWIKRLHADTEGMHVHAGDPLFDLYSPDLRVGIEELITSRRARSAVGGGVVQDSAATLYQAAANKLELLGLERAQIETLAKLDRAPDTVTFTAPVSGDVTEKVVVDGAAVKAGDRVLRIVDRSVLWLDAQVFEKDLPFVRLGQKALASIASLPGSSVEGEIIFVAPRLDATTRTTVVRLAIPNSNLLLKPGMYATVSTESRLSEHAVLAPREAVIDTGEGQIAFVALPQGRFEPRRVQMGPEGSGGLVQVLGGLSPGETIVTSGQFLLDSESRLREAIQKFLSQKKQAAATPSTPPADPRDPGSMQPRQEKVDAVAAAYLALSTVLGAPERDETPIDPAPLIAAADALAAGQAGSAVGPLASSVARATEAMRGNPLGEQRQAFKAVSQKMIALFEAAPPSATEGAALYVMHCPMAKADWVQKVKDVANPYYATDMKTCGSLTKTIGTRGETQP